MPRARIGLEGLAAVARAVQRDAQDVDEAIVVGSTRIWLKYMGRGLTLLTRRQVSPPSSER